MPDSLTPLGLLERVSVALAHRVDVLEVAVAKLEERSDALRDRIKTQESMCVEVQKDKRRAGSWFRRSIIEPAVKQPHLIALYALVLLLGAKSCGMDVSDLTSLWGATPMPVETNP